MAMTKPDFKAQKAAGQKYYQTWKAMQQQGVMPAVVSKDEQPILWEAWRSYYRQNGLWAILNLMDDGRREKTVPCLDPAQFEPPMAEVAPDPRVKDD